MISATLFIDKMADSSDENDVESFDNESLITDDEEELMPSDEGEDDSDDQDELPDDKFSRFRIEHKKDEMASDIEDDNEEEYLPNSQAWGKNKKLFYDTDFVDKDFRGMFFSI